MRVIHAVAIAPLLSLLLSAQETTDAPDRTPSDFVRFVKVGDGGHLDTAITTYRRDDVTVILFGAVHIADAACYALLNDRFTTCDVLLYELVAPPDARPGRDREEAGFNPLSLLQRGLRNSLELTFQLDEIDYQAANFVHADMTPQEFQQSLAERGESLLSILWNSMVAGMRHQAAKAGGGKAAPAAALDLVQAFRSGEGRHMLRMTFAEQLEDVEAMLVGGRESTLLEGRNEKCLEVLQRELAAGHKRLGIYYGAAHLPHLERRLVEDLGFRKVDHEWIVAWDCSKRPDPKYDRELVRQRRQAREELEVLAAAAKAWRLHHGSEDVPTVARLAAGKIDDRPVYTGPLADPWGRDYVLQRRPTGSRWQAMSAGQDGVPGTADDLVAIEPRSGGLRAW
jgi:hypothetical protein